MKRFILFVSLIFFFCFSTIQAQSKLSARELLEMDTDKAIPIISNLSKTESEELITQIRVEAKKDFEKIDNYYFLIHHLESIVAIEKEQTRLNSLHLVYILGLILFVSFLVFIFIKQRKAIESINRMLKE